MITYFPKAYPDELLYSQLARYYVGSGYMAYIYAAEDLFISSTAQTSIEFLNTYTSEALQMITRDIPMEDVVLGHTMFPYYGRFLPLERRQIAFRAMASMQGNYHKLLPLRRWKNGLERHLRYCPICAGQDRRKYGETYWHRTHQMIGLMACPIHGCYLSNSSIIISGETSPILKPAEEMVPILETAAAAPVIEQRIAVYMNDIFQKKVDIESDVPVGRFLRSCMSNTKYCSEYGRIRNFRLLYADFVDFYKELSGNRCMEPWQVRQILTDDRKNFYEICLLALFLDIPSGYMVKMKLPEKSKRQLFDEDVRRLRNEGLKYIEIAKRLNVPCDIVKYSYKHGHKKPRKQTQKRSVNRATKMDWQKTDEEILPLISIAVRQLQSNGSARPKRVTIVAVERELGFFNRQIYLHLPKCLAEIQKHMESQEQYWAREMVWAVRQIENRGSVLNFRRILELTNIRRKDFEACLPYIRDYADVELENRLKGL